MLILSYLFFSEIFFQWSNYSCALKLFIVISINCRNPVKNKVDQLQLHLWQSAAKLNTQEISPSLRQHNLSIIVWKQNSSMQLPDPVS